MFLCLFDRRFTANAVPDHVIYGNEQALITWVNEVCRASVSRMLPASAIPSMSDLGDVGDGRCLAAVLSFHNPDSLPLTGWFFSLGVFIVVIDSLFVTPVTILLVMIFNRVDCKMCQACFS